MILYCKYCGEPLLTEGDVFVTYPAENYAVAHLQCATLEVIKVRIDTKARPKD